MLEIRKVRRSGGIQAQGEGPARIGREAIIDLNPAKTRGGAELNIKGTPVGTELLQYLVERASGGNEEKL